MYCFLRESVKALIKELVTLTHRVEREIGGRIISVESGKMGKQAGGAAVVRYGDTVVFCAAVGGNTPPDVDFFPLTMDYREKIYAAGKIPGGFFKREGRPTTKEILTMRLMARPIRPLFPDGYRREVAVSSLVLSADRDNDPDILAMIGASAALTLSEIPFLGPTGAVRIGMDPNGEFIINPTYKQISEGLLDLVVAGTKDAVTTVESGAKELPEETILEALRRGHEVVKIVVEMLEELREQCGKEKETFDPPELYEELYNEPGIHEEPEEESLKKVAELCSKWAGEAAIDKLARLLDPEDAVKFMSGAIGWGTPTSAYGYSGKDYEYYMTGKRGFEDIIQEIDVRIEEAEEKTIGKPGPDILPLYKKIQNWDAMKLVLEAAIRYARRYARLARIVAENFESDPQRREELLRIAETCEQVPAKPPRNLQESLQLDHFVQVLVRFEAFEGAWPARPDYYHGPYYDKDVNVDKRLSKEEALDLVGEFLIRAHEVGLFAPRWGREGLQGITGTWVWTLGGVKPDGSDACNDMTIALLQAARLVRVSNPTFGFRWHPKVKDEVMRECFECIRQGLGYPSMRNDPVLVHNSMHWHGHPLEEARLWVHQACMSPCPPTKHGAQPFRMASATANCAKIVEYALSNGYDHVVGMQMGPHTGDPRKFTDFEQLFQAWVRQMEWLFSTLVRTVNLGRYVDPELYGRPFLSATYERSVESGLDAVSPEGERGNCWITAFTWVENADSLAAVKRLVFDEKKYTMDDLIKKIDIIINVFFYITWDLIHFENS